MGKSRDHGPYRSCFSQVHGTCYLLIAPPFIGAMNLAFIAYEFILISPLVPPQSDLLMALLRRLVTPV